MRDEWFVARRGQDGNKRYGPVPLEQLRDMIDAGNVRPDDLVWRDGMANWQRADQCSALSPPAPQPRPYPRDDPRDGRRGHGYDRDPRGYGPDYDDRPYRRRYPSYQQSNGWVVGVVVGGIIAVVCFLGLGGLVFSALMSDSYSSPSYTTYPAPTPAPVNWNNNFPNDPPAPDPNLWQPNPPVWVPPDQPIFVPDPPVFVPPDPPIFVPPDPQEDPDR